MMSTLQFTCTTPPPLQPLYVRVCTSRLCMFLCEPWSTKRSGLSQRPLIPGTWSEGTSALPSRQVRAAVLEPLKWLAFSQTRVRPAACRRVEATPSFNRQDHFLSRAFLPKTSLTTPLVSLSLLPLFSGLLIFSKTLGNFSALYFFLNSSYLCLSYPSQNSSSV